MYKLFLILLLGLSFSCIGCAENKADQGQMTEPAKQWESNYFTGINERLELSQRGALRDVALPDDAREIRIWTGFDTSPVRGVVLTQNNEGSEAFFLNPLDENNLDGVPERIAPRGNWNDLWAKLDDLGIMTLPDPLDYALIDGGGGTTFIIELKNGRLYRNYKYSGVGRIKEGDYGKIWEINNVLIDEFGIDLTR